MMPLTFSAHVLGAVSIAGLASRSGHGPGSAVGANDWQLLFPVGAVRRAHGLRFGGDRFDQDAIALRGYGPPATAQRADRSQRRPPTFPARLNDGGFAHSNFSSPRRKMAAVAALTSSISDSMRALAASTSRSAAQPAPDAGPDRGLNLDG